MTLRKNVRGGLNTATFAAQTALERDIAAANRHQDLQHNGR
ncbi:MAG: hypothetical protein NTV40_07965 [Solirubrobacterales bacterium]|nr:hypothetical protein [Solirubrobacterales bacterium]